MRLPKLVRDLIPKCIEDDGRTATFSTTRSPEEHQAALAAKMEEELFEFMQEPCLEEAADMYEVLRGLANLHGMLMSDVITTADLKVSRRGGFRNGIILESVRDEI